MDDHKDQTYVPPAKKPKPNLNPKKTAKGRKNKTKNTDPPAAAAAATTEKPKERRNNWTRGEVIALLTAAQDYGHVLQNNNAPADDAAKACKALRREYLTCLCV